MEQDNQNDAPNQAEQPVEQKPVEVAAPQKREFTRRKNGRNSRHSASQNKSDNALACGEIADISAASERLSGKNVNGYTPRKPRNAESEEAARQPKAEVVENSEPEAKPQTESENGETQCKCTETEHEGPSFERRKFTPRTIEVSLDDSRPNKRCCQNKLPDGVVSYSAADEADCPSLSLFARIKAALKSIFSGKKGKKFDKKNRKFDKNFKKDFKGKRKFNNNKYRAKNGGRGGNKNFNRRHP